MLEVKNVCISLIKEQRKIIEKFSFTLQKNDKVAIIGEEGNGKSTLLKLLYNEDLVANYTTYSGEIKKSGNFGYLPQFMESRDMEKTLYEFFLDVDIYDNFEYISLLNLDYEFITSNQLIKTLSGGERVKIQLLRLLCNRPDALFLDEPSNDIDISTLLFLEDFIQNCTIPVVFISHDETLIENTANTIIHIEQLIKKTKCKITISGLNYADYLKSRSLLFQKQTQVALKERSEYKKKQEKLRQLYEKARSNSSWKNPDGIAASDGHAKNSMKALISKGKRFERESENFTDIPDREDGIFIRFNDMVFIPNSKIILDLVLEKLEINGKELAKKIELKIIGAKHICIIGNNGVGKTTLLKKIWIALKDRKDIIVGYMPQNYQDVLDFEKTPVEYFQAAYSKEERTKAMTYMGAMKFTSDEMFHPIKNLSGGQKAKLIYLDLILKNCNVLILDEPTRNFSPLSAPVIRQSLIEYKGTIISISHDRKYLDEVVEEMYELTTEGLRLL